MSRASTLFWVVIAGVAAWAAPDLRAQPAPTQAPQILAVRVGLAGAYKAGLWTPVEVLLQGGSKPFEGTVAIVMPDGDGVPSRLATASDQPCRIRPGQRHWVRFVGRLGRQRGDLAVEVSVGDRVMARRVWQAGAHPLPTIFPPALPPNQALLVSTRADQPCDWSQYSTALFTGPTLVRDGKYAVAPRAEGFKDPGHYRRARRTAVGITQNNKLLLVAVASPVSLTRMAAVMKALGARHAVGLDGGTSAALHYRGSTLVRPGRGLTNIIAVYATGRPQRLLAGAF